MSTIEGIHQRHHPLELVGQHIILGGEVVCRRVGDFCLVLGGVGGGLSNGGDGVCRSGDGSGGGGGVAVDSKVPRIPLGLEPHHRWRELATTEQEEGSGTKLSRC